MNSFMQGILIGMLIYSSIAAVFIVITEIFDWEDDMTLAIISGPIGWIICSVIHSYCVFQTKKWRKKQDKRRKEYERNRKISKGD